MLSILFCSIPHEAIYPLFYHKTGKKLEGFPLTSRRPFGGGPAPIGSFAPRGAIMEPSNHPNMERTGSMGATAEMTIGAFLDALAARESTPGGGGAAAVTAGQAAALLSMVINFTLGNKKYAEVESEMQALLAQSEALRGEFVALADRDVEAFTAVSACYTMPKGTDEEKAARTAALQTALKGAAEAPFVTAEKCVALLELAEPIGARGNANVVSDAATAIYLAHAALQSALLNVNINLKFIRDEEFNSRMAGARDALLLRAQTAHSAAKQACEQTLGVSL